MTHLYDPTDVDFMTVHNPFCDFQKALNHGIQRYVHHCDCHILQTSLDLWELCASNDDSLETLDRVRLMLQRTKASPFVRFSGISAWDLVRRRNIPPLIQLIIRHRHPPNAYPAVERVDLEDW